MKILYMIVLTLVGLIFCLANNSKAEQICFEWGEYEQTQYVADKFTISQSGPVLEGTTAYGPSVIFIDGIATTETRVCKEITNTDNGCFNYWVSAWYGDQESIADPNQVIFHCFKGRPGGHHGFFIIQVREP